MEMGEIHDRLVGILAAEGQEHIDWAEVERLCCALQQQIPIESVPEIVHHFLDDADIRVRDQAYAMRQRREVRRFVETGLYDEGISIPRWGCALILVFVVGVGIAGRMLL